MQYIFNENASLNTLTLQNEDFKYLFKVKRLKQNDLINLRNLKDNFIYIYKIVKINKKEAILTLEKKILAPQEQLKDFELFWCIIETKIIEKTIPFLNQIGVKKINFIYCKRSQKNFKLDLNRLRKILINSNQQCGRVDLMEIEIFDNLSDLLKKHKDLYILDFGGEIDFQKENIKKVLVGPEGGFCEEEQKAFKNHKKIAFKTKNILKSETAAVCISAKILI